MSNFKCKIAGQVRIVKGEDIDLMSAYPSKVHTIPLSEKYVKGVFSHYGQMVVLNNIYLEDVSTVIILRNQKAYAVEEVLSITQEESDFDLETDYSKLIV